MKKKMVRKHFDLTEYENKCLRELVEKSGSSCEVNVIRDLILGSEIVEAPGQEFYDAMRDLRKIGTNINQIAHMANATGMIDAKAFTEESAKLDQVIFEVKRIALEPRMRRDAESLDRFLEYAVFKTEEEDKACYRIRQELKALFNGDIRREADGNNKDMADS